MFNHNPPTQPGTETEKTIKGTVYASEELYWNSTDWKGIVQKAADWIQWTYEFHGYSIDITRVTDQYANISTEDVECQDGYGAQDALEDWIESNDVPQAKDFNLVICYEKADDGTVGCGGGAYAAIEKGKHISQLVQNNVSPHRFADTTDPYHSIHTCIHEVSHCLGIGHNSGHATVDDDKEMWYYSPQWDDAATSPNTCGYEIPSKPAGYGLGLEMTHCACALTQISIV